MTEIILISVIAVMVIAVVKELFQFRQNATVNLPQIQQSFDSVKQAYQNLERSVRDEITKNREAATAAAQKSQDTLQGIKEAFDQKLQRSQADTATQLAQIRQESLASAKSLREEIGSALKSQQEFLAANLTAVGQAQKSQLEALAARLDKAASATEQKLDGVKGVVEAKLASSQDDNARQLDQVRVAVEQKLQDTETRLGKSFQQVSEQVEQIRQGLTARPS